MTGFDGLSTLPGSGNFLGKPGFAYLLAAVGEGFPGVLAGGLQTVKG
jgi:hypothetical protein